MKRQDSLQRSWEERQASILDRLETLFVLQPPRRGREFLKLEKQLGRGGFGTVFRGRATRLGLKTAGTLESGRTYAIKQTVRTKTPRDLSRSLLATSAERNVVFLNALKEANAHNCIHILAMFVERESDTMFTVMELLEGPDLYDFLQKRAYGVPERTAASLAQQMLTAVHYFHRHLGAVHRDIKPENFGFARPVVPKQPLPPLKLFDIGLAWVLPAPVTDDTASQLRYVSRAGTWLYMAPESWNGLTGPSVDVWATGLVTYLLLSLQVPFGLLSAAGRRDPAQAVQDAPLTFNSPIWSRIPPAALELVSLMLNKDPEKRATTSDALEHSWLSRCADPAWLPEAGSDCSPRHSLLPEPLQFPFKSTNHAGDGQDLWQSIIHGSERMSSLAAGIA